MPIDQHVRLTMAGDFVNGTSPIEIWQWGLKFPMLGTGAGDNATEWKGDAAAIADLWTTHIAGRHTSAVRLRKVRVSGHAAGGLTNVNADGSYDQGDWEGTKAGTRSGGALYPLQTSVVVSLKTARAGASGKGRVFLPQVGEAMGPSFTLSANEATAIQTGFQAFLVALRPLIGAARVFSTKGGSSPVTGLRVGNVMDTQRSRRGSLPESYVESTLPA